MSNQNAGANEKSCPWCVAWNAARAAATLDPFRHDGEFYQSLVPFMCEGEQLMMDLATRETDCPDCQRSAEIYGGNLLGAKAAKWRAAMWRDNPTMQQFMKRGPGDIFEEVRT